MKIPFSITVAMFFLIIGAWFLVFGSQSDPKSEYHDSRYTGNLERTQIPQPHAKEADPSLSSQQIALSRRLAAIPPLCEELREIEAPIGRKVGSDYIWVIPDPSRDYYYLLGANIQNDGSGLVTVWAGANLSAAVSQFCGAE